MKTKYGQIKVIVDHTGKIDDTTVRDILHHCQHNQTFALVTEDDSEAMVYFPKHLTARHTNGEVFTYNNVENFIDSIKLTLLSYPTFLSCRTIEYKDKPILITEPGFGKLEQGL